MAQGPDQPKTQDIGSPTATADVISRLTNAVYSRRPVLASIIAGGDMSLRDYAAGIESPKGIETIQPVDDVKEIIVGKTQRLLGDATAAKVAAQLKNDLVLDTSHHMAVEFYPLTMQTLLVAAQRKNEVVVALAGAGIPGLNLVMPLGPSLVRETQYQGRKLPEVDPETGKVKTRTITNSVIDDSKEVPVRAVETVTGSVKFNVLPGKTEERAAVATMPAFTEAQVRSQLNRVAGMFGQKVISYHEKQALESIFQNVYLDPDVLAQSTYSDQATVANHKLFPMLFAPEVHAPELVYLEFEGITTKLITKDLADSDSLISRVLFDDALRQQVMGDLQTVPGCWDSEYAGHPTKGGTEFFWGIDGRDRSPVGMQLVERDGQLVLSGRNVTDIAFTPEGLTKALQEKKILPGLFLSFAALTLARGEVSCYGGFMQTDYLTRMRDGLAHALETTTADAEYQRWAQLVRDVQTENYILGMTPVTVRYPASKETRYTPTQYIDDDGQEQTGLVGQTISIPEHVRPAGTVEIIAAGGITADDWRRLGDISFITAGSLALADTYGIVVPPEERDPALLAITTADIYDVLGEQFVEKSPAFQRRTRPE